MLGLRKETHSKRPIPAGYVSIFLQKALFDCIRLSVLPVPLVSCSRIGEIVSRSVWGTHGYRISKKDSLVLGRL